jgi:hypothetical protein
VGCYFKSFLAALNGTSADLLLKLGALYHVKKITIQKLSGNSFTDVQAITDPTSLQFNYNDPALKQGANIYRAALQLSDGRIIYSSNEIVYFLNNTDYLVYPNPVHSGNVFRIQQREPMEIRMLMHDATGRLVKDETYSDLINPVNVMGLQKGLYIITIVKEGVKVFRGKVVVN